eukprot:gnl/MRDRNA2_/MRDRNA2_118393_c0_seq1.p1 gnl/MRDRNA2_/MRDRNA2_118393_c0~~gnl/MRDRNA2_/MRDRNA2_118393_c0_seq1.p1  ORF type:complete len:287 (+),score=34.34 gnl/MRDRNA2_/MRDRNA2_118393_c0_seq1:95-862(+)
MTPDLSKVVELRTPLKMPWTFFVILCISMLPFVAFQKKLLPVWASRIVARLYFWPTLPFSMLTRLYHRDAMFTKVDDTLFLGGAPLALLGHPQQMANLDIQGVVNMQTEYAGPQPEYARLGIRQIRLPTVDHFEPRLVDLIRAVSFIEKHRRAGQKVYVHCKAGHGRAGAVAFAWLIFRHNQTQGGQSLTKEDLRLLNMEFRKMRRVRKTLWTQPNLNSFALWAPSNLDKLDLSDNANPELVEFSSDEVERVKEL